MEAEFVKIDLKRFEELEKENNLLRQKINNMKDYKKDYFINIQKHKIRHCELCNLDFKINSFSNHLRSKKHLNLLQEKNI
jgi:hypothetical protein